MLKLLVILTAFVVTIKCNDYRRNVIVGLDLVLNYVTDNHKFMNIDALFGLVLTQAHLRSIVSNGYNKNTKIYASKIASLEHRTKIIIQMIKPYIKSTYKNNLFMDAILFPKCWERNITFQFGLIDQSYDVKYPPTITYDRYITYLASSKFVEAESDECFVELLEKALSDAPSCKISSRCKHYMVDDGYIDPAYGVTHRLLFLQIARSQNCNINNTSTFFDKIKLYCSHMFWEASKNMEFGFVDELDDLFLEQVTLCGYEGFEEFLVDDFVEHILSIQTEHGCFMVPEIGPQDKRNKREANLVKHGCNDHSTGLGASCLALILRYLMSKY